MSTILISACLLGENCKYNGKNNLKPELLELQKHHTVIPVCPEVLGGLPIPRNPVEIVNQIATNSLGENVDREFRLGAEKTLEIAKYNQIDYCILQSRSPSCGVKQIYDGSFSGTKIPGMGITASLLAEHGFKVFDSEEYLNQSVK